MLIFFDYVYFQVCGWYTNTKDQSPHTMGSGVVSICQAFNIFFCLSLIDRVIGKTVFFSIHPIWVTIAVVLVLNYIRYEYQERYQQIKMKWEALLPQQKVMMRLAITLYIAGSIAALGVMIAVREMYGALEG